MKGRLNSAIIALVVINLAATLAVFMLAYFAGARSGGRMLWELGSLHSDGTSLTVNKVDGVRFDVLLIHHSLQVTTWGQRQAGDRVNIEIDTMARYAARLADAAKEGL